jgi:deazaflavin-dependent oxidoreductase (nitroreductase family)
MSARLATAVLGGSGPSRARAWLGRRAAPFVTALGFAPRTVTLETVGRSTGRPDRVSLTLAQHGGARYAVSLQGERPAWVQNLRAADGRATIIAGRRRRVRLVEIPESERAPILLAWASRRAFTHSARSSARTSFGLDRPATLADMTRLADRYAVFRVEDARVAE